MLPKVWIAGFNPFSLDQCGAWNEIDLNEYFKISNASPKEESLLEITSTHALLANGSQLFSYSAVTEDNNQQTLAHKVVSISASNWHCLILLENGDLFRYDIHENRLSKLDFLNVERPSNVSNDEPETITMIACGDQVSLAVTSAKSVFNIPNRTITFPRHVRISKIAVGLEHCLVLTTNGDVYSFGGGLRGQLGNGEIVPHQEQPELVDALAGVKIVDIAAGGWHSVAVSAFGDAYCWGWNSRGQLGLPAGKGSVQSVPQLVDIEGDDGEEVSLEKVYCGSGHSVGVCSKGRAYFAGNDLEEKINYLKVDRDPKIERFKKFSLPAQSNGTADLKCGPNSLFFLAKT
ncbi:RCC1 domain-containing protein 1 [Culex pipiens pallens]|uniref:RCC1 domain-containing protein 1 n=1 Tax=Culex pipiens pallens TaxID=42434 RepID=UPI001952E0DF|nr:RCC1 domain-containing protein 1 [Culex pipiens pallens]